jgi:hypothetical protein
MAQSTAVTLLIMVALFQTKHFLCDGLLQTRAMVDSKSRYPEPLGLLHAAIHGIGTMIVCAIMQLGWPLMLILGLADFVIHYAIDWAKENIVKHQGWNSTSTYYWWGLATDQYLHHLTHTAFVAVALLGLAR